VREARCVITFLLKTCHRLSTVDRFPLKIQFWITAAVGESCPEPHYNHKPLNGRNPADGLLTFIGTRADATTVRMQNTFAPKVSHIRQPAERESPVRLRPLMGAKNQDIWRQSDFGS
jgi:hypothetical protein